MTTLDLIIKLSIAVGLAGIIGLEREIRKKPLGFKTSLVICLTSCLITIISIESAHTYAHQSLTVMDPMRLAAQIVSGVGFMGAGAIMVKRNDTVSGLTTAAMIWAAAGLGIAVGAGFYEEAVLGTLFIFVSVEILPKLIKMLGPARLREKELRLTFIVEKNVNVTKVLEDLKEKCLKVANVHIKDHKDVTSVTLNIDVHAKRQVAEVYMDLKDVPDISGVEIESL